MGWKAVHQGLNKTPFCQKREMFVKLKFCFDHSDCGLDGLCEPFLREGVCHKVLPQFCHRRYTVLCEYEM